MEVYHGPARDRRHGTCAFAIVRNGLDLAVESLRLMKEDEQYWFESVDDDDEITKHCGNSRSGCGSRRSFFGCDRGEEGGVGKRDHGCRCRSSNDDDFFFQG